MGLVAANPGGAGRSVDHPGRGDPVLDPGEVPRRVVPAGAHHADDAVRVRRVLDGTGVEQDEVGVPVRLSTVPIESVVPRNSAADSVSIRSSREGAIPASASRSISSCSAAPGTTHTAPEESVPTGIGTPAASKIRASSYSYRWEAARVARFPGVKC